MRAAHQQTAATIPCGLSPTALLGGRPWSIFSVYTRSIHQESVEGTLTLYDRLIFKGHLTRLFIGDTFRIFLAKQGAATVR